MEMQGWEFGPWEGEVVVELLKLRDNLGHLHNCSWPFLRKWKGFVSGIVLLSPELHDVRSTSMNERQQLDHASLKKVAVVLRIERQPRRELVTWIEKVVEAPSPVHKCWR